MISNTRNKVLRFRPFYFYFFPRYFFLSGKYIRSSLLVDFGAMDRQKEREVYISRAKHCYVGTYLYHVFFYSTVGFISRLALIQIWTYFCVQHIFCFVVAPTSYCMWLLPQNRSGGRQLTVVAHKTFDIDGLSTKRQNSSADRRQNSSPDRREYRYTTTAPPSCMEGVYYGGGRGPFGWMGRTRRDVVVGAKNGTLPLCYFVL